MDSTLRDIRFALKMLTRDRGVSVTVLLTLGVCIATNVATFSVVRSVVLNPLPFDDSSRLVTMYNSYPLAGAERSANGVPDYFMRRERIEGLEEIGAYQVTGITVGGQSGAAQVTAMRATPSLFPMLGVEAAMGRTFLEEEMEPGAEPTMLVTHGYWQEALGGQADVVGTTIRADGVPTTVVGVLPEDFRWPSRPDLRLVAPLTFTAEQRSLASWHSNSLQMLGRLAPEASPELVAAQVAALNDALMADAPMPNLARFLEDTGFRTVVVDAREDLARDVRPVLYLLWGAAAFVLLIGCVNIANLMLARTQSRERELATRISLGAQRGRVARQVLTEAGVMGLMGAALGTGLGMLGLQLMTGIGIGELPGGSDVGVDGTVLLYTLALGLTAALAFGAIPVIHLFRSNVGGVFRGEGRGGTASHGAVLVRNALVSGQVALAFVLLVGAGLMFRSFQAALDVDPGFQPQGVSTAAMVLPESRYDETARRGFAEELIADVRALPGVSAAGITTQIPFGSSRSSGVTFPEGYLPPPDESILSPWASVVGPGYFEAMDIEVLAGRDFAASDGPDDPPVMVIDEWLADHFWPDGNALGQRMVIGASPGSEEAEREENLYTVVGIVENLTFNDLTSPESDDVGAYYLSHAQKPANYLTVAARTTGDPNLLVEPVRRVIAQLDPELPMFDVLSMEERIGESLASRRATMMILLVFAGVALTLSIVGVYGVLAYTVARRTREIGIRMAVGSDPGAVFGLVLKEGLALTALGLVLGGAAAMGLTRFLESFLFGVRPADPLVLATTAAILVASAAIACVVPARRATRVDPNRALAAE